MAANWPQAREGGKPYPWSRSNHAFSPPPLNHSGMYVNSSTNYQAMPIPLQMRPIPQMPHMLPQPSYWSHSSAPPRQSIHQGAILGPQPHHDSAFSVPLHHQQHIPAQNNMLQQYNYPVPFNGLRLEQRPPPASKPLLVYNEHERRFDSFPSMDHLPRVGQSGGSFNQNNYASKKARPNPYEGQNHADNDINVNNRISNNESVTKPQKYIKHTNGAQRELNKPQQSSHGQIQSMNVDFVEPARVPVNTNTNSLPENTLLTQNDLKDNQQKSTEGLPQSAVPQLSQSLPPEILERISRSLSSLPSPTKPISKTLSPSLPPSYSSSPAVATPVSQKQSPANESMVTSSTANITTSDTTNNLQSQVNFIRETTSSSSGSNQPRPLSNVIDQSLTNQTVSLTSVVTPHAGVTLTNPDQPQPSKYPSFFAQLRPFVLPDLSSAVPSAWRVPLQEAADFTIPMSAREDVRQQGLLPSAVSLDSFFQPTAAKNAHPIISNLTVPDGNMPSIALSAPQPSLMAQTKASSDSTNKLTEKNCIVDEDFYQNVFAKHLTKVSNDDPVSTTKLQIQVNDQVQTFQYNPDQLASHLQEIKREREALYTSLLQELHRLQREALATESDTFSLNDTSSCDSLDSEGLVIAEANKNPLHSINESNMAVHTEMEHVSDDKAPSNLEPMFNAAKPINTNTVKNLSSASQSASTPTLNEPEAPTPAPSLSLIEEHPPCNEQQRTTSGNGITLVILDREQQIARPSSEKQTNGSHESAWKHPPTKKLRFLNENLSSPINFLFDSVQRSVLSHDMTLKLADVVTAYDSGTNVITLNQDLAVLTQASQQQA